MRKFILNLIFVLLVPIWGYSQTVTIVPLGNIRKDSIPIKVEHYVTTTNSSTFVRVFRTHYGNGNTSQYAQYPSTRSEMDKLFNTTFAATTWWWQGNINGGTSLNFTAYTTLTSAGVSVPSGGDYYATEVTFNFVAAETGTYSFGITSDDGSDLTINGTSVIEYYGGKGIGSYKYGTYSMVKGSQYTVVARMQEYGGGDGLIVRWKRPSQSSYSLQLSEVGTTSSTWTTQGTKYTDSTGKVVFTNSSGAQYRVTLPSMTYVADTSTRSYFSSRILQPDSVIGFDWYCLDVYSDNKIDVADIQAAYYSHNQSTLRNGLWFTQSEYNSIVNSTTNPKSTYPPYSSAVISNQNTFYIVVMTYPPKSFKKVGELK